jgi:hypothetical protein
LDIRVRQGEKRGVGQNTKSSCSELMLAGAGRPKPCGNMYRGILTQ